MRTWAALRIASSCRASGQDSRFPDLTGKRAVRQRLGTLPGVGSSSDEIKWVDTVNDDFDLGGSATGAGLGLTSNLNFGKKNVGKFRLFTDTALRTT